MSFNNGYIYAKDNKRVFINTSLGCEGACSYCYLPQIGLENNSTKYNTTTADNIIGMLKDNIQNINKDTLITIGCYSECWDKVNKEETIKLIKYFLENGNQIQIATKKQIKKEELTSILPLIKYYGQLVIFVSSSTISKQINYENNTTPIIKRFKTFNLFRNLNIPVVLYIKPVLANITIKDTEEYKKIIKKHHIKDVVVGSMFTDEISEEKIHFSDKNKLYYTPNEDENIIMWELSCIANIYGRSSEVMSKYKNTFSKSLKKYSGIRDNK